MKDGVFQFLVVGTATIVIAGVGIMMWNAGRNLEYRLKTKMYVKNTIEELVKQECLK